ncbi:hypothetical protein F0562_012482 [Nyssa sinensis]|uniref:Nucleoside phosphorylase domain-containing protein n=1 Tax=Nyssa sinensis TaxID=561372 RepID=A0A5J4ZUU9_9ASTE|nr:hypothetical protein F0562_012482 [Nyssa sinensis]
MKAFRVLVIFLYVLVTLEPQETNAEIDGKTGKLINQANENGPYLGVVIPNLFEMNPLLESSSFNSTNLTIDFAGRRFRFGTIENKEVILVLTGLGMINAGITTQLLVSLFDVEGVLHYGIAGNVNPSLNIGDVAIPQYWSHHALWNWQRYGDGPDDELALEVNGDYTREIGYIKFANYSTNITNCNSHDNLLNNVWYQPEEVFPIDGTPEERQHAFWVPIDTHYFEISKKLEGMKLDGCINSTTCLSTTPKVASVLRGASASIFIENAAYRSFIQGKFNVSVVDMESAAVALVCFQQRVPFITFRALSGDGSARPSTTFASLAVNNSVRVVVEFIKNFSAYLTQM